MNPAADLRARRLRALGVAPLQLHVSRGPGVDRARLASATDPAVGAGVPTSGPTTPRRVARLALLADPAERSDPAIDRMYVALTEAVGKAGLQPVRVCDVAEDPSAAVLVFGAAPPPAGVPSERVLRADPLAALHADRGCKRRLWERMQALGRHGVD